MIVDVFITFHKILIAEKIIINSRLEEFHALLMNSFLVLDDSLLCELLQMHKIWLSVVSEISVQKCK